jgi:hypothetical protein
MAERDRETIVTTDGGGGAGTGMIVGILLVLVLAVVLFFLFGRGMLGGSVQKIDADVKIDTPATK